MAGDGRVARLPARRQRWWQLTGAQPMMEQVESWPDGDFVVRRITGASSTKPYRCPGCDQAIRPATPHMVAWPEERVDERRHWHTVCWRERMRRRPKVTRSRSARRY